MLNESLVEYLKIAGSVLGPFAIVGLFLGIYRSLHGVSKALAPLRANFESPFKISEERYPDQYAAGKFSVLDIEGFGTLFVLQEGLALQVPTVGQDSLTLFFAWDRIERFRIDKAQTRARFQVPYGTGIPLEVDVPWNQHMKKLSTSLSKIKRQSAPGRLR